jgi:glycosyl hydrolase family 31
VDVYLPAGRWIDLYTGEVLAGGRQIVRNSTLDDFPLYLRAGGAFGFNRRVDGVWAQPWGLNDLDRRDRHGWLYAPGAGLTTATSLVGGELVAFSGTGFTHLVVAGAPPETQVIVATPQEPRQVFIDGRLVPKATGPLSSSRVGWTIQPAPFGGVLLKLAPRAGVSTVTIKF